MRGLCGYIDILSSVSWRARTGREIGGSRMD